MSICYVTPLHSGHEFSVIERCALISFTSARKSSQCISINLVHTPPQTWVQYLRMFLEKVKHGAPDASGRQRIRIAK